MLLIYTTVMNKPELLLIFANLSIVLHPVSMMNACHHIVNLMVNSHNLLQYICTSFLRCTSFVICSKAILQTLLAGHSLSEF